MKLLIIGLLTLSTTAAYADHLQDAVTVLQQDYQMICNETSKSSAYCHESDSKLVGINLSLNGNHRGGVTLSLEEANNSKNALLVSNRAKDTKFWGKKIVTNMLAQIQEKADADCSELHANFVGEDKEMVFSPWWNEIMRSECVNGKGESLDVKVNLGKDGNFLRNIKIIRK